MDMSVPSRVACLLCREDVYLVDGDQEQYEGHLRDAHGVWSNRLWIVEQTFLKQKDEESLVVNNDMTRIKVKKLEESEVEHISDLHVLSVKLEDSLSCEPLRRSSRKRSASTSRSSSERKMTEKKPKDFVTIAIREPEDLLLQDEALNSPTNNGVYTSNSRVSTKPSKHDSALLDLNMNCQMNTDPEPSSGSFDIGEECESKCVECKTIFKVSSIELHVRNVHGVSLKDYLEVHGDPQTGKMKLCSTFYHFCSFCNVKLLLIRSEVEEHLVIEHKTSLITYVGEVMKTKDVNGNESVSSNEAEAEVVASECLISSSDEDVRENKSESKLNDPGLVDDTVTSDCLSSTDDDAELVATDESSVKPESESQFPKLPNSSGKFYSDSFDDSCIVECSICDKHMLIERLRGHTSSQHHLPIAKYKEQFGSQLAFVKTTYHLCKLCGKEVLLDKDSIATHVRGAHRWTAKQYNSEHMVMRKRKVGQVDEDLTLFQLGESIQEAEVAETSSLNEQQWFDANTFTCKMCMFASTSLDVFKKHVKLTHKMSLSKFSCWYIKTDAWYTCQCCDKEVYHERSSIKAHVEGHLLSMQQYAWLYERRKILELEREKKDKLEYCVVLNNSQELEFHNMADADNDPEKDPLEITCDAVESPPAHLVQLLVSASPSVQAWSPVVLPAQEAGERLVGVNDFIAEIVESIIPPFGRSDAHTEVTVDHGSCSVSSTNLLDDKCDTSSLLVSGSTDVTAPSTPTLPDIYLYMCPFHGCDFHTDFKGMQSGVAAKHGASLHQAETQQVVERGLEWKKVSLETRMEQLFAGN